MRLPPVPKRLDNIDGNVLSKLEVSLYSLYFKAYGAHSIPTQQKVFCALWLPFVAQCQLRTTPLKGFVCVHRPKLCPYCKRTFLVGFVCVHWTKDLPLLHTNFWNYIHISRFFIFIFLFLL